MKHNKRLRLALLGFVLVASVATAAATAATSLSRQSTKVARKDSLILGQFRTPTGYYGNVYVAASDPFVSDGIHQLVYEPLFYDNPQTGKLDPWLATGFQYDKTYTKLTINLKPHRQLLEKVAPQEMSP